MRKRCLPRANFHTSLMASPPCPNAWRPQPAPNSTRKARTSRSISTLKKVINISCYPPRIAANLLNPAYNVVGLGVVRSGDRLFIVQDFGHALPNYSAAEVKDRIAATVAQARHEAKQPGLSRRDLPTADDAACSMAHADKLGTSPVHQLAQRYTVLTYTSLHPETLPEKASRMLASHNLRSFSVGACYARTDTYPTGVYWVVLSLD